MRRKIQDSVVVVTGASSGIGRATAVEFARTGATVVAAARNEQALQETTDECRRLSGRALAVPLDVTNLEAVKELVRRAVESFGRIDIWVNNAAVTLFARFEEAPLDAYRRVIETNLFGYIHGARAILPHFREHAGGVLINVSSVVGTIGQPYTSAYVATKFAIRGLSACLRQELRNTDIHVCTVMPATVDTPLFQHGANYIGRAPQAMPPVYSARHVAETIVRVAQRPQREVFVGSVAGPINFLRKFMPGLAERMMARQVEKKHFQDLAVGPTQGNLFAPMPQATGISGGWQPANKVLRRQIGMAALGVAGVSAAVPFAANWIRKRASARKHPVKTLLSRLA
ncbi:MAG: SDR family oxidoreductase [Elusimicrobia bacterium]|nr:SDR family oxidoreductase [Elusimicrobiota bacterium]